MNTQNIPRIKEVLSQYEKLRDERYEQARINYLEKDIKMAESLWLRAYQIADLETELKALINSNK